MRDPREPWPLHALQWSRVASPLRPTAEDVSAMERHAAALASRRASASGPFRALLLGVTPELATMRWPRRTSLLAMDRSAEMIRWVWPRSGTPAGAAVARADWRSLPIGGASIDLVLGDGSLSVLHFPDEYVAFSRELRRVLAPAGHVALRAYTMPAVSDSIDDVLRDLRTGALRNFHAFKWRLAMAVQPAARNVRLADIHAAASTLPVDLAGLGFGPETLATLDVYRDAEITYSFPTEAELIDAVGGELELVSAEPHTYEIGDRCPTLVFRRR